MSAHLTEMLLFDLAMILVIARVAGAAARRLGQPAVIGEIVAGIVLGPTVLGARAGGYVFPEEVRPWLTAIGNVGLAIFMFMVGMELDRNSIGRNLKSALSVSIGSTLLPFGGGVALAYLLIDHDRGHHPLAFVVFVGAAMSISSFPVLARILTELTLHRVRFGALAMTCAAASDVIAWAMLAAAMALASKSGQDSWLIAFVPLYLALMIGVVRPLLRRLVAARPSTGELVPIMVAGLLLSGVLTGWMGLHLIFGAFLFGAVVPADGAARLRHDLREQLGTFCTLLLLPVFFVVAGLQVDLTHAGLAGLGEILLILLVAITGKSVGVYTTARLVRVDVRRAAALATLMNTRGVTELIVLLIGIQVGVLDRALYSYMVVMAVVTTAMAGPIMRRLYPRELIESELAEVVGREDDELVLSANATRD